jgi:hypothetical protein
MSWFHVDNHFCEECKNNTRNGQISIILDGVLLNDTILRVNPGHICYGQNIGDGGGGGSPIQRPAAAAAIAVVSDTDEDQFDEDWEPKKTSAFGKREFSDPVNCLINIQTMTKIRHISRF